MKSGLRLLRVQGDSMQPTLKSGDLILVTEGSYKLRLPRLGDVVVAQPAVCNGRRVVKRVAALPEKEDAVYLVGENAQSADSRDFGPVTRRELLGRVRLRLWPFTRF